MGRLISLDFLPFLIVAILIFWNIALDILMRGRRKKRRPLPEDWEDEDFGEIILRQEEPPIPETVDTATEPEAGSLAELSAYYRGMEEAGKPQPTQQRKKRSPLVRGIIFSEILGKPRALRPYDGNL